jgi:hypothetical protein
MNNQNRDLNEAYYGSRRHFELYEPYLVAIVNNWPTLSTFSPTGKVKSVETLVSRIRMAKTALRNNQWTDTKVNLPKFIQICDEIVVTARAIPGKVVAGPEDLVRKKTPTTVKSETVESQDREEANEAKDGLRLTEPTEAVIRALLVLHHAQVIVMPSTIVTDIEVDVIAGADGLDVAVMREGNVWTVM